jgi:hypothetical protein
MSNGNPPAEPLQPGAYIPTDEVPDVIPPKPSKYPLSSAPLPEGVTPESVKKQTAAISNPDAAPAAPAAPTTPTTP